MPANSRRPKLGQHFLHDPSVLTRIAGTLALTSHSRIVEIGPGEGALTERLIATGAQVTAVEIDRDLASRLRNRFGALERFQLIEQDVLQADLDAIVGCGPAFVVGNLPYYITSPILRRVVSLGPRVEQAVFLVQKEVALRVTARKGSRDYAFLSALCRLHAEPELLFSVRSGAFRPPPRVDSAVIRLTPRAEPLAGPEIEAFLQAAFRQPRKTLLNNLGSVYGREQVAPLPEAGLRAQQLDVEELIALARKLVQRDPPGQG